MLIVSQGYPAGAYALCIHALLLMSCSLCHAAQYGGNVTCQHTQQVMPALRGSWQWFSWEQVHLLGIDTAAIGRMMLACSYVAYEDHILLCSCCLQPSPLPTFMNGASIFLLQPQQHQECCMHGRCSVPSIYMNVAESQAHA